MAKKKRKDEAEDGYEFKPDEFDRTEFLRREFRDAKAAYITIGYALVMALASLGLTHAGQPHLGIILGILAVLFLRHLFPMLGVDTSSDTFKAKNWLSSVAVYLFTWIAVWILLVNPPFMDMGTPGVEKFEVFGLDADGNYTILNNTNDLNLFSRGETAVIVAFVVDNVEVAEVHIEVEDPTGNILGTSPMTSIQRDDYDLYHRYEHQITENQAILDSMWDIYGDKMFVSSVDCVLSGEWKYEVTGKDTQGLESTARGSIRVTNPAVVSNTEFWRETSTGVYASLPAQGAGVGNGAKLLVNVTVTDNQPIDYPSLELPDVFLVVDGVERAMEKDVGNQWRIIFNDLELGSHTLQVLVVNYHIHQTLGPLMDITIN